MEKKDCKRIFNIIKQYDSIVIARHMGPDPDALGSQIVLRDAIKDYFPEKKVYAIGAPTSKFKYLGTLDKMNEEICSKSLYIIVDTPDRKRVDGPDPKSFAYSIKIDHHPFLERICEEEFIDDSASSVCQIIVELIYSTKFRMKKEFAEKLFQGIVSDTNRFMFAYTSAKTFYLVNKIIEEQHIDFTKLYEELYMRPLNESRFMGYIEQNIIVEKSGFAHIKLTSEIIEKFKVDPASAGNMINNLCYIDQIKVWAFFSEDNKNKTVRVSVRSRDIVINKVAEQFGGGGHKFACGIRLANMDEADKVIEAYDGFCKKELNKE